MACVNEFRHGSLLVLEIDHPPVNAIGSGVKQALSQALQHAEQDSATKAIVIKGAGSLFSAGADVAEFGQNVEGPTLPVLLNQIEACSKPVVASIHGVCLGGGLELALACHYRIADDSARMGLPEVKLGLLPGAGGTQRLPRLIGVEAALEMVVKGDPVSAEKALSLGLIDSLAPKERAQNELARYALDRKTTRPTRSRAIAQAPEVFERFAVDNMAYLKGREAPAACIEAVRAATELPFDKGSELEYSLFLKLKESEQSLALRHVFFAQRKAAKIENLPADTSSRSVRRVGVVGAGTMGRGIAISLLSSGIPVTLVDMSRDKLNESAQVVEASIRRAGDKKRLGGQTIASALANITYFEHYESLSECDLIIEAVYEDMGVKQSVFQEIGRVANSSAILASNTSFLDIDQIASSVSRPEDVVGMHFFSPANIMKLVEVVRATKASPEALATVMALARKMGKIPVLSGVSPGFIGNRMVAQRRRYSEQLVLEGATPDQIDRVHTDLGMPMGPFQMSDLVGLDVGWHRDPDRVESIKDMFCAAGRFGQKARAGYYDYDDRRRPSVSDDAMRLLETFRKRVGVDPRVVSDDEIITRTLYTMINEGYRILEEGIAQRASDIDLVWIFGYGWPDVTGGPMFWAERRGLDCIAHALHAQGSRLGKDFVFAEALCEYLPKSP